MQPHQRPDAIVRAGMPDSSRGNPATPILIGLLMIIIVFVLLLIFMGIIPLEAVKGGEEESEKLGAAINQAEVQAMNQGDISTLNPDKSEIPAKPDPILSSLEQPFIAEEEHEERE